VDEDCIRLTSYFRSRQRADGMPLADALTSLYAGHPIAASVVLRGTGGSMTMTTVGPRLGLEATLGQAAALTAPGRVTVRQARLLTGDIATAWLGVGPGEATRLVIYLGSRDRVYQVPAFEAACELLYRRGIAGATVLPGVDVPAPGRRQRPRLLRHDAGAPLVVVAVDPGNEIGTILPELGALFRHPVMTVEKVQVCKRGGQLISHPQPPVTSDVGGMAAQVKLTVYASEAARHDSQPVHRAITRQLEPAVAGGVTAVRGSWGFHADHPPHGDHFPHRGRHLPAVTAVIGPPERISAAFDIIDALTADRGLVTAEAVLVSEPAAGSVTRPAS
jgi:PII-like signaling protein